MCGWILRFGRRQTFHVCQRRQQQIDYSEVSLRNCASTTTQTGCLMQDCHRVYASMSLIKPLLDYEKKTLTLTANNLDDLVLPLNPDTSKLKCLTVTLWSDKLQAFDVGDEAADWMTKFFIEYKSHDQHNAHGETDGGQERPTNIRLVTLDLKQGYQRPAHPELSGINSPFTDWSPVSFGFTSSLEALNGDLVGDNWSNGHQIPMNRFRNNLTITGTEPWEEDTWLVVR